MRQFFVGFRASFLAKEKFSYELSLFMCWHQICISLWYNYRSLFNQEVQMHDNRKMKILSNIMLILAAAIWGSNFIFQKTAATEIGPFLFMACRSILGSLTLIPIILFFREKSPAEKETRYSRKELLSLIRTSAFCGFINVSGSVMVQFGLIYTNASKAGFLNAIYIIFVPVLGMIFFKVKSSRFIWLGILLAVIGLYNLCLSESLTINPGDLIILASTLCFALHIQLIAKYVHRFNGMHLSCLEFFLASVFCLFFSLIFEEPSLSQIENCLPSILFAGVLGIGVCYALQVTAQKYTDPTVAALLMSLESVFGALGGVLVLGETFTVKEFIGVLFIIAAIVIAQIPAKKTEKEENTPA